MHPFTYHRVDNLHDATTAADAGGAVVLAGGTELVNWMRLGLSRPTDVVDINRLPDLSAIDLVDGTVHIGALTRLNDVAGHPLVRDRFPVLTQAIHQAASAQLRNLATIGGNPLQLTRCPYFRSETPTPCNKRRPGSGCAARHGISDQHAIFGWTDDCVAVQPADPATALAALDAVLVTESARGGRRIPARDLHVLPSQDPAAHHVLRPDEIVTRIEIPGTARRSAYVKVRERASYEYAIVAAAVALEFDGTTIRGARIALGSVAMRPWRLDRSEQLLIGSTVGSTEAEAAVTAGFADARPLPHNAHKIPLARNAVLRAIEQAAAGAPAARP
ncbi:FAD binding domain-containing protein [Micromonospora sp. NBC_01796]|uniref:FAD binding domain-containing protein n=1 Tax=Micromonospora sp. NBC_01796 TaxID=2975987 RepID=UPI002DD8275A|nr:xanthine dehydrogenase family protein subunit M [Micromonospora sp. NBC_01796]WSA84836.1 xanthine dehydrogenase family protein subunit M [Micromonospora sp. NBC_01796]